MSSTGEVVSLVVILQLIPDKRIKLQFGIIEAAENLTGDIDGEYLIVHDFSSSWRSLIRGIAICAYSLMHEMRSHSSFQFLPEKEIKPHLVFWLPVKVRFRTRIYSTHQRKLLSLISHLCKKVNRMHKKQPQMRLF